MESLKNQTRLNETEMRPSKKCVSRLIFIVIDSDENDYYGYFAAHPASMSDSELSGNLLVHFFKNGYYVEKL